MTHQHPEQLTYSRASLAKLLDVSADTLRRLETEGKLTPLKLRGRTSATLYSVDEVHQLLNTLKAEAIKDRRRKGVRRKRLRA